MSRFNPSKSGGVSSQVRPPHNRSTSSSQSSHSIRNEIRGELQACRAATLRLFADTTASNPQNFRQQAHPDFSPAGWHLGHIGYTESLWILEHLGRQSTVALPSLEDSQGYRVLFAQDGLPKAERQNLPAIAEVIQYLDLIRRDVLTYLDQAPAHQQLRLWWFLLQHESQHGETIAMVHQLLQRSNPSLWHARSISQSTPAAASSVSSVTQDMVYVPEGVFQMGSDHPAVILDNEGPSHRCYLSGYWIDRFPVTCADYRRFMQTGGYQQEQLWGPEGWQWLQHNPISQPLYWQDNPVWDNHPVCGISWHEASAYARFAGKRLPTEAEWEKAARWSSKISQPQPYPWEGQALSAQHCNYGHHVGHTTPVDMFPAGQSPAGCMDMLGNVWEWTTDHFEAYPMFEPYPYAGYSQRYFDRQHYVLKGGSWATQRWTLRPTFRNWYPPDARQLFSGFRCASSG